jgi:hypothetical protein
MSTEKEYIVRLNDPEHKNTFVDRQVTTVSECTAVGTSTAPASCPTTTVRKARFPSQQQGGLS